MLQNHTGFQTFPLSAAGGGDFPSLVQGSPTVFNLNTVPLYQGSMANYIPALEVTITGNLVQAGGTGVRQPWDNLYRILVESLELRNAWHGSPISPQNVKGAMMPLIEQFACGYRNFARKRGFFPVANGTYPFSFTFPVPLSLGVGSKPHHTAQLAALYKEAQFSLQVAQASVLTALSPGATLTSLQVRCSAILLPDPEIRVGPVIEFIDYQVAATAGQVNVPIQSFGNNSQLTKMEKGAALFYFGLLTSNGGLPGPFLPENVTRLNVPWRGQTDTGHMVCYLTQQLLAMGNNRQIGGAADQGSALALSDTGNFPYTPAFDGTTISEMAGLLAWPIVTPAADLELTKIQTVDGDESLNVQLSSGPSGTWHNLAGQARSWQPGALQDLTQYLVNVGLPSKILKGGSGGLTWMVKSLRKNDDIDAKKTRYLPLVLKRENKDKPFNPTTNPNSRRMKLKAA
jgi:hypothetical protein